MKVSPCGFYASQLRPESTHSKQDRYLRVLVQTSFRESRTYYGSPRVHRDLVEAGVRVAPKGIARLMKEDGLVARKRKRFKVTTMSDHDQPIAGNILDRQFQAEAPNQRWVSDTTEMMVGSSGKLYLAAVCGFRPKLNADSGRR